MNKAFTKESDNDDDGHDIEEAAEEAEHAQLEVLEVRYERIPMDPFREPPGAQSAPKTV